MIHVQNAAQLLQRMDTFRGSYGHASKSGALASFGDGSRPANPLFKKVLYELTMAEKAGMTPEYVLKNIYRNSGNNLPAELVNERQKTLLDNLKYIKQAGLDSPENLDSLSKGNAPKPTRGNPRYIGKDVEVGHVVARAVAPQYENEVANLRLEPFEINRAKLAGHGPVEQERLARLNQLYRPVAMQQIRRAAGAGFVVGSVGSLAFQIYQGEDVNWAAVAESGGIVLASSAATVILAQQIEQRFGKQLAQSFISKNVLPGLARGSLSGAAASTGVGAVVVLGFVAKDYFTDQITANEALIQSGIGLGSVGVGVGAGMAAEAGAGVILTWAYGGAAAGSEAPGPGNAIGFVVGLIAGTAVYIGGEWYYENFKLEGIRAEMAAFKQAASKWEAHKMETEIKSLRESASALREQAAQTLR